MAALSQVVYAETLVKRKLSNYLRKMGKCHIAEVGAEFVLALENDSIYFKILKIHLKCSKFVSKLHPRAPVVRLVISNSTLN